MASATVLAVDDDPDTRELYGLVLSLAGWNVLAAGTVRDAIRLAAQQKPLVVLSDWLLPDGRGSELCEQLHRIGGMRRTPIIAITGVVMTSAVRLEARKAGIYSILEKPVLPERITEVVQEAADWCRGRQLRAAAVRVSRSTGALLRQTVSAAQTDPRPDPRVFVASAASRAPGNIAIMIADDGGHYVAANATASALTGYAVPDLLSLSVWDLTPTAGESEGRELWNRFIQAGSQEGKYVLRRRDGAQVAAQYCAIANVAPGLHLSALAAAGTQAAGMS